MITEERKCVQKSVNAAAADMGGCGCCGFKRYYVVCTIGTTVKNWCICGYLRLVVTKCNINLIVN